MAADKNPKKPHEPHSEDEPRSHAPEGKGTLRIRVFASEQEDERDVVRRVKVTATGFGDVIGRRIGAELGGSAGVVPWVDLGLAATLGPRVGGRLTVSLHTPRPVSGLSPFLQLRGILNPVP